MKIHKVDIAKTDPDSQGGYDLLVDMNQVGLNEDEAPATEIQIDGQRFHRTGRVVDEEDNFLYWSYWNDGRPAINLQLHGVNA
jgi:hypothetical protein